MAQCPRCSSRIPDGSAKCPNCGADLIMAPGGYAGPPPGPGVPSPGQPFRPPLAPPPPGYYQGAPGGFPPPPPAPEKTSGAAAASLILAILGVCSGGILGIVGMVVGFIALSSINKSGGRLGGKGLAIGGIAVGGVSIFVGLFVMGIVAAISIPSFLKYQGKAKQAVARTEINDFHLAQQRYYLSYNEYADSFDTLGWFPRNDTSYAYFLGQDEIQPIAGGPYDLPRDVYTWVEKHDWQIIAVANIDSDPTLDIWMMNSDKGEVECLLDDSVN